MEACCRELEQLSILYLVVERVVGPRAHLGLALLEEGSIVAKVAGIQSRSYLHIQREACTRD